ncbi:multicopper oxidase [Peniophora sp. CONT]|nr:multicopper oxidase [Peniophora sp. CONT]
MDQHLMTVIEVDGNNVQSLVVASIQIYAGQRYSFVLNANQKVDKYWIRSSPNTSRFIPEKEVTFDNGLNSAILRYKGAKIAEPTTPNKPSVQPLVETNLHPLVPTPPPQGPADKTLNLQIALDLDLADNTGVFTTNNATYTPPKVPHTDFISGIDGHKLIACALIVARPGQAHSTAQAIEGDGTNHHTMAIDDVQILVGRHYSLREPRRKPYLPPRVTSTRWRVVQNTIATKSTDNLVLIWAFQARPSASATRPTRGAPAEEVQGALLKEDYKFTLSERGLFVDSLHSDPTLRDTITRQEAQERWETVRNDPKLLQTWKDALSARRAQDKASMPACNTFLG